MLRVCYIREQFEIMIALYWVVNLLKDYDSVYLQATSTLMKTEAIEQLQFNPNLTVSEDYLFLNTILLRKSSIGVV